MVRFGQLRAPKTHFTTFMGTKPTKQIPWLGPEIPAQGPDPYIRETLARLYKFSRVIPSRALPHLRRRRSRFAARTCRRRRGRLRSVQEMVRRFFSSCYSSLCPGHVPLRICRAYICPILAWVSVFAGRIKWSVACHLLEGRAVLDACD
jgi:hypothetical protein